MLLDQDEERFFIRVAIECFSDTEILEEEITRYIDIVCAAPFRAWADPADVTSLT